MSQVGTCHNRGGITNTQQDPWGQNSGDMGCHQQPAASSHGHKIQGIWGVTNTQQHPPMGMKTEGFGHH